MAAIIAIVIAVIAFAIALAALILVLLLRSSVSSSSGKMNTFHSERVTRKSNRNEPGRFKQLIIIVIISLFGW